MLILTRKPGESVYIGDDVKVTIVEIKGNQIRVGIDAPRELRIYREEIYLQILEENKLAAEGTDIAKEGLEGLAAGWQSKKPGAGASSKTSSLTIKTEKKGQTPEVIRRKKKQESDDD